MTITRQTPATIHLGGPHVQINDMAASAAITPGQLVELNTSAGVTRWRKTSSAGLASRSFAKEQAMTNKGIDDDYAAADLVEVGQASPGCVIYGWLASGQSVAKGAPLSDNGDGSFKAASGVTNARALDTVNNTAGPNAVRIRAEFI